MVFKKTAMGSKSTAGGYLPPGDAEEDWPGHMDEFRRFRLKLPLFHVRNSIAMVPIFLS